MKEIIRRGNIRESFEDVYLRKNWVIKYSNLADPKIINSTDFKKSVNYSIKLAFLKNHQILARHGFTKEDLNNIGLLFGMIYYGMPSKSEKNNTYMIYFIMQRFNKMIGWIAKKFQLEEVIDDSLYTEDHRNYNQNGTNYHDPADMLFFHQGVIHEHSLTKSDKVELIKDEIETIKRSCGINNQKKQIRKIKKLKCDIKDINREDRNKRKLDKELLTKLQTEFKKNPSKYRKQLAHYATSKHVSGEIRKVARKYCRVYDIDYVAYVKELISNGTSIHFFDIK